MKPTPPTPGQQPTPAKPKRKPLNPQALVSKFWSKYHSKAPGKVTSIFPQSLYESLLTDADSSYPKSRNAAQNYEDAAKECRARVRAIVRECERTNAKFSDPDFDIETDFSSYQDNCLNGLMGRRFEEDSSDDEPASSERGPNIQRMKKYRNTRKKDDELEDDKPDINKNNLQRRMFNGRDYGSRYSRPGSVHRIPWIFENPQFTVGGFSSTDIKQGAGGDCWWLAALATIAHRKDLMKKICVAKDEECGVYGFVFNRDGEWISTVVDDNLYLKHKDFGEDTEVYDATGKKARLYKTQKQTGSESLYFAKCEDPNETWLPLLEKAVSCLFNILKIKTDDFSLQRFMVTIMLWMVGGLALQSKISQAASILWSLVIESFARRDCGVRCWDPTVKMENSSLVCLPAVQERTITTELCCDMHTRFSRWPKLKTKMATKSAWSKFGKYDLQFWLGSYN